jgi:hypothetical protein
MKSIFTLPLLATAAFLAGCASQPQALNYGHPALNAVAQPAVIVVQQPVPDYSGYGYDYGRGGYVQNYPVGYATSYQPAPYYTQGGYAPGYAAAPPVAPRNDAGRTAVGALAGGLVGSQFGGSRNARTAATVVGAGAGAMVAQGQYSNEALGGAVLGGVVGSRFGKGEGRNAAAALGAGLGAWMAVRD